MTTPPTLKKDLTVRQAAAHIRATFGIKVSAMSVYRWINHGRKGVRLNARKDALGRMRVTKQDVQDFFNCFH